MQTWLEPINFVGSPSQSPLCAVLVRIRWYLQQNKSKFDHADFERMNDAVRDPVYIAARVSPGNLREYSANIDADVYGSEVVRTEQDRLELPRLIQNSLSEINEVMGDQIEWCLPLIDPELNLPQAVNFVQGLRGQNWLSIHVICDIDLKRFFGYTRNVTFSTETEFVVMNVMSEAMETLRSKSTELSLPNPLQPNSNTWNLGIGNSLK